MFHPELTHDYLKTLRALAVAVVEARRVNPESPDALATEISPFHWSKKLEDFVEAWKKGHQKLEESAS